MIAWYVAWIGAILLLYPLLVALPFRLQDSLVLPEPLLPRLLPFLRQLLPNSLHQQPGDTMYTDPGYIMHLKIV